MIRRTSLRLLVAAAALLAGVAAAAPAGAQPSVEVIAEGLNNPRGIAIGPGGHLYVAEAGAGGDDWSVPGPEGEDVHFGHTGAVTRVRLEGRRAGQEQVLTGLPSLAAEDGSAAIGPMDVTFAGSRAFVTFGLGADPNLRNATTLPGSEEMARLVRARFVQNAWESVADIGTYEATADPNGDDPDSNPTSVIASGNGQVLTDAGGNSLLAVDRRGRISTLAVFPNRDVPGPDGAPFSMDAVPTTVAQGSDGAYYVGQLTGFPFPPGGANVYRVVPGQEPTVYASGFTNIIDIGFGRRGELYVLEIATNGLASGGPPIGALKRVNANGSVDVITTELFAPGGMAVQGRNIYVSNCGVCAGGGQVLRINVG